MNNMAGGGRLRVRTVVLAAAAALAASPAPAQVYRWTDADGHLHYSQGIESVPPALRGDAVVIGRDRPAPAQPSAEPAAPAIGRVRFTPGRPIVVTARINGGGTADLMLDTGATRTVINPRVLQSLGVSYRDAQRGSLRGVTGEAPVLAVTVDSIEVNGVRYGPLLVISHDTNFGEARVDGLLGRDFLDHFTVTIDNAAGLVTLTPK